MDGYVTCDQMGNPTACPVIKSRKTPAPSKIFLRPQEKSILV